MIRFRLSNGVDFAVEFSAASPPACRLGLADALSEYHKHAGGQPELHVRAESAGHWISPNYPRSNRPLYVSGFASVASANDIWDMACGAVFSGTQLAARLAEMADMASIKPVRPTLRIIRSDND